MRSQGPNVQAWGHTTILCPWSTACPREEGPFPTRCFRDTPRLTFIHEISSIFPWPFSGGCFSCGCLLWGSHVLTLQPGFQNCAHVVNIACFKSMLNIVEQLRSVNQLITMHEYTFRSFVYTTWHPLLLMTSATSSG